LRSGVSVNHANTTRQSRQRATSVFFNPRDRVNGALLIADQRFIDAAYLAAPRGRLKLALLGGISIVPSGGRW
jgi:hypothetical protein